MAKRGGNIMKKTVLLLVLSLLISSISMSFAQSSDRLYLDGNKIERIFTVRNGNLQEISINEYSRIKKYCYSTELQYHDNRLQHKDDSFSARDGISQILWQHDNLL